MTKKLYVVGLGPGSVDQMTLRAVRALEESQVIAGYTVYVELIKDEFPGKVFLTTPMKRELERGGQVYYLHNRVETIERTAARIQALLPEARIGVGHGKMTQEELSELARILAQRREVPPSWEDVEGYCSILENEGDFADPAAIRNASEEDLRRYLEELKRRK